MVNEGVSHSGDKNNGVVNDGFNNLNQSDNYRIWLDKMGWLGYTKKWWRGLSGVFALLFLAGMLVTILSGYTGHPIIAGLTLSGLLFVLAIIALLINLANS